MWTMSLIPVALERGNKQLTALRHQDLAADRFGAELLQEDGKSPRASWPTACDNG